MPHENTQRVVFKPDSQEGMQRGINQIVNAIRPTLGPRPRVVAVENVFRQKTPELLDDGGVIARRIVQLSERNADVGGMLVRHLLWRLHEEVGDATATAAVIFQSVYNQGLRYIAAGGNAMHLRRYLECGAREIVNEQDRMTLQIDGKRQLTQLAESLCYDPRLATMLGEIFDMVGEYGQVDIRTGHRRELERQYVEGIYWPSRILSPHMLADQVKLRTDLTNTAILISDLEIEDPRALFPLLTTVMETDIQSLVIVANKLSDTVVAMLLAASREPQRFRVIAAQTPGTGTTEQMAAMEDLSILTGGRRFLKVTGDTLTKVKIEDLGHARRAWCDRSNFGIVAGKGDPRRLRAHIATLRAAFMAADDQAARSGVQQRIGKLMGGSAVLWVGGNSEPELAAHDALARRTSGTLRTALREGVLPGGGTALLACRPRLRRLVKDSTNPDEQAAYRILLRALEEPIRTIVSNAGYEPGAVMAQLSQAEHGHGFDVRCGKVVNMEQAGILDVAVAQKAAVHGAITSAALALTVDILVHKRNPEATPARP